MGETLNAKGYLLYTPADQEAAGGSSMDEFVGFAPDTKLGDTKSDDQLRDYYQREIVDGTRRLLAFDALQLRQFGNQTEPIAYEQNLNYCRGRGIDVTEGEAILAQLKAKFAEAS